MEEIEKLRNAILKDYPRLNEDSTFSFKCCPGIACFNECCGDVNIFLTPYDIIRLKKNLGIDSEEFLKKYTITPFDKNLRYPVVMLMMGDDEKKKCPFVADTGCTVYADRPWACRMYPIGQAAFREDDPKANKDFYFILQEGVCQGHYESVHWTVKDWLKDQNIEDYNQIGELFKELTLHPFFQKPENLTPQKLDMFFMVCYNIDKFRSFLFDSTFFQKFDVDEETKNRIKEDDVELLKFGFLWLRFSLFGERTMQVKSPVLAAKQKELEEKKKLDEMRRQNAERRMSAE